MSDKGKGPLERLFGVGLPIAIALVFAGLATTIVALPPVAAGLSDDVNAELGTSGINSPVTATLLDFRSYDTLLEIAVLLLAVVAIGALRCGEPPPIRRDDAILAFLAEVLVPVMILIAGYLLMAGLDLAGGAFQAGAILAAAGVLSILAGWRPLFLDDSVPMRIAVTVGLATFIAVGLATLLAGNTFLDYPGRHAGVIVLLLEAGVTVSAALALLKVFAGVLRPGSTKRNVRRPYRETR